jgi:hypothetical protein
MGFLLFVDRSALQMLACVTTRKKEGWMVGSGL